jgi:hypothetical protein
MTPKDADVRRVARFKRGCVDGAAGRGLLFEDGQKRVGDRGRPRELADSAFLAKCYEIRFTKLRLMNSPGNSENFIPALNCPHV